jgi:hypothetical protein
LFVPWQPSFPPGDLDVSWCMALQWAFIHHIDFGNRFVFTFGPWGFVWQGFDPATFNLTIAAWLLIAAAYFAGTLTVARKFAPNRWWAAIWLALLIGVAGADIRQGQDVRLFAISWLLILVHFHVDDRPLSAVKILLIVAMALASEIKFSHCILAGIAVSIVSLDLLRRRRFPWIAVIYVIASLGFWLGARQPLGSLLPYLRHSLEISSHYSYGESLSPPTEVRDVSEFVGSSIMLLAMLVWAAESRRRTLSKPKISIRFDPGRPLPHNEAPLGKGISGGNTALAAMGLAGSLFIAFKAGYVRHDGHEAVATTSLALLALLYVGALFESLRGWWRRSLIAIMLSASWSLCGYSVGRMMHIGLPAYLWDTIALFPAKLHGALQWADGTAYVAENLEQFSAAIRKNFPIPPARGGVDVFPWQQSVLLANGFEYRPRPVFQSYLTLTPALAELNAEFLRGPRAPDSILFTVHTIDLRLPAIDDAPCWPELLTQYDLKDASRTLLLLERARVPRRFSLVPAGAFKAGFNQWVTVPKSSDPIWVTIDVRSTPIRAILGAVYKAPNLSISLKTRDGKIWKRTIVPEMTSGGFLLSPVIRDRWGFAELWSPDWSKLLHDSIVTEICVAVYSPTGQSASFDNDYSIAFSSLGFPHRDISNVPGLGQHVRIQQFAGEVKIAPPANGAQLADSSDDTLIYLAPTDSRLLAPAPPDAKSMRLHYGILGQYPAGETTRRGVEFRAYAVDRSGLNPIPGKLLWSAEIEPSQMAANRGDRDSGEIQLPAPPTAEILLETIGQATDRHDDPYWSDVEFR